MRKRRICRENSKYAPNESFVAIFALAERLPTSATLYMPIYKWSDFWHSRAGGSGVVHEVLGDLKIREKERICWHCTTGYFNLQWSPDNCLESLGCQTCRDKKSSFTKMIRTLPGERLERRSRRRRPRRRSTPTTSRRDRVSDRSSASWPSSSSSSISLASHGRWRNIQCKI